MVVYNLNGHLLVVRRIGMTKPPVKLEVGKKFLEKRKEPPSGKMKLVWQPQHLNIGGSMSMNDVKSLSHSKWRCKIYNYMVEPIKTIDINTEDDREKDREYYINSQE